MSSILNITNMLQKRPSWNKDDIETVERARKTTMKSPSLQTIALLLIDCQNDFCEKTGSLYVPGADIDCQIIAKFLKENTEIIDEIYVTLDSHHRAHIGHPCFWNSQADGRGEEPKPFTQISSDIVNRDWFSKDPQHREASKKYSADLEQLPNSRTLTIWPEHCLIGTKGHCLQDDMNAALDIWAKYKYGRDITFVHKGMNNLTEMYSAIKADVPNDDPLTQVNEELLDELRQVKQLIICGQAASHCVNYTTRDIVEDWENHGLDLGRIYILKDATSPVQGCEFYSNQFFEDMKAKGLNILTCNEMQAKLNG